MGFTTKEMIQWYKDTMRISEESRTQLRYTKIRPFDANRNGLYLHGKHTIVCLQNGRRHNDCGPAYIIVGAFSNEPLTTLYYLDGKIIQKSDIVTRMIQNRERLKTKKETKKDLKDPEGDKDE